MLQPGAVLNGRYLLEERIAAGGMGEIWRGVDTSLHRRIAVKVLLPFLVSDAEFITRFRTEARMMAALRHPGIVQVYDGGQATLPGGPIDFLVMEFIEGTPLSTMLQQSGRLGARQTLEMMAQAADALHAAHEAGIVHRDVKPSNLLIRPGGAVVLVDFGVARSTTATGITGTNVVMGTAHYMAPEQAEGKPVSAATDVYALGAVAYCCLAGRTPYVGSGPLEILGQLVYGPAPTLPPDVPTAAADVVLRAMDKDPARRYPDAAALAEAARSALDEQGSTGRPATIVRLRAGRVALPSHDRPRSATTSHTAEPLATAATGDNALVQNASQGQSARRFARTLAVLATGAIVGAVWATANAVGGLADDASQKAQTSAGSSAPVLPSPTPDRSQPGPAPKSSSAGSPSAGPQTSKPADGPVSPAFSTSVRSDHPATNPYAPNTLCGPGYRTIDSAPLRSEDTLLGNVYLLTDDTGSMCVVTLKTANLDQKTPMSAYLQLEGADRDTEAGNYESYAGPVRETTVGECIQWGGSVDSVAFDSPLQHCD